MPPAYCERGVTGVLARQAQISLNKHSFISVVHLITAGNLPSERRQPERRLSTEPVFSVSALMFECGKCKEKMYITKKMK